MEQQKDIFDKLMHLPGFRIFEPFYQKHKEALIYIFFGGLTFFLNFFLFIAIDRFTTLDALINNIICWVVCVIFQFFTNRIWVFDAKTSTFSGFFKQLCSFFGGRLFTLIVEEVILAIFITALHWNTTGVKLFA